MSVEVPTCSNVCKGAASSIQVSSTGRQGPFISLSAAQNKGLVEVISLRGLKVISSALDQAIVLKLNGKRIVFQRTITTNGQGRTQSYGPTKGPVTVSGSDLRARGRGLRARSPDKSPPVTRAKARKRGKKAVIRLKPTDRSGVSATYVLVGKKLQKGRKLTLKVPLRKLKKVRFYSVDVFGNKEKPKKARLKRSKHR